jgi:hypothetical protein
MHRKSQLVVYQPDMFHFIRIGEALTIPRQKHVDTLVRGQRQVERISG